MIKPSSNIKSLNKYSNCIEIYDNNKQLKGYIHIDLLYRQNKRTNQITVIILNNQYVITIIYINLY